MKNLLLFLLITVLISANNNNNMVENEIISHEKNSMKMGSNCFLCRQSFKTNKKTY